MHDIIQKYEANSEQWVLLQEFKHLKEWPHINLILIKLNNFLKVALLTLDDNKQIARMKRGYVKWKLTYLQDIFTQTKQFNSTK